MNRRIETALRSKYNFRKHYSKKETNELCAQGYCVDIVSIGPVCILQQHISRYIKRVLKYKSDVCARTQGSNERVFGEKCEHFRPS